MDSSLNNIYSGIDLYFGKFNDQDRILRRQPDQRDKPNLEIDIVM